MSQAAKAFSTSAPPTVEMTAVALDWTGVKTYAEKAIKLIQDHGDEFIDMIDAGFRAFKAVTGRDFAGIFTALNDAQRNLQVIIAAIRTEFGI